MAHGMKKKTPNQRIINQAIKMDTSGKKKIKMPTLRDRKENTDRKG